MKWLFFPLVSLSCLLTGCGIIEFFFSGSQDSGVPIQLTLLENPQANVYQLDVLPLQPSSGSSPSVDTSKIRVYPLTSQASDPPPVGIESSGDGSKIYLGFRNRIWIISRASIRTAETSNPPRLSADETISPGTSASGAPCSIQNFRVSTDDKLLSALLQCGSVDDPAVQHIWVYSLEKKKELAKLANPSPISEKIETVNKLAFPYLAFGNRLFFIKPNVQDRTRSELYNLELKESGDILPADYKPKVVDGIFSLGLYNQVPVALTASAIQRIDAISGELSKDINLPEKATVMWSNVSRAAFWDSGNEASANKKIRFRSSTGVSENNSLSVVQGVTFSNDNYAWLLSDSQLFRYDVALLSSNPTTPIASGSVSFSSLNLSRTFLGMGWILE